eukprot:342789-Amphidinium_carterae.1
MRLSPALPSWTLLLVQLAKLLLGEDKESRCCSCCVSVGVELEKEERKGPSEPSSKKFTAPAVVSLEVLTAGWSWGELTGGARARQPREKP